MPWSAKRWGLVAAAVLVLAVAAGAASLLAIGVIFDRPERSERSCMGDGAAEELRLVRDWARLAPLPDERDGCLVHVEGSRATRAFRVEFVARAEELDRWVEASPGLRDAHLAPHASAHQRIAPGGGAQWAEVSLRPAGEGRVRVEVYVYWS